MAGGVMPNPADFNQNNQCEDTSPFEPTLPHGINHYAIRPPKCSGYHTARNGGGYLPSVFTAEELRTIALHMEWKKQQARKGPVVTYAMLKSANKRNYGDDSLNG